MWVGKDLNLRTRMRTDLQSVAFNPSATYPLLLSLQKYEKKIVAQSFSFFFYRFFNYQLEVFFRKFDVSH
jgi:hypothetical protein